MITVCTIHKSLLCFQNSINAINITTNDDNPEAMLEALLQAAVCKEVIGWREAARKLVLVMTDRGFHFAGDGKVRKITIDFAK